MMADGTFPCRARQGKGPGSGSQQRHHSPLWGGLAFSVLVPSIVWTPMAVHRGGCEMKRSYSECQIYDIIDQFMR